jgi:hypothetical protein
MLQNRLPATLVDEAILPPPTVPAPPVAAPTVAAPSRNGKSPSPHGDNGDNTTTPAGRDANGRFAKGNPGGPGNPFARRVAELREAALSAITPEEVTAIVSKLKELALAGDVAAAKVLLAYTLGKPATMPNPDRLDVEEWQGFRETAPMVSEAPGLMAPNSDVLLASVRFGRYAHTRQYADMLGEVLHTPQKEVPALLRKFGRNMRKKHKRQR